VVDEAVEQAVDDFAESVLDGVGVLGEGDVEGCAPGRGARRAGARRYLHSFGAVWEVAASAVVEVTELFFAQGG
jgi:hypothetical protein